VQIQVDKLKRVPRRIDVEALAADFSGLDDLADEAITFDSGICGTLQASRSGEIIEVSGQLSTSVTMPCGRCLTPVSCPLEIPVTLCYVSESDDEQASADEVEIKGEELGLIPFSTPEIDLRPDLAQEIIMALPQQPLCGEDCLGLCPVCGNNLNQSRCNCEPPVFHSGLAALKNFKAND